MSSPHPFYKSYNQRPASSPHPMYKSYDVGPSTVPGPYKPLEGGVADASGSSGGFGAGDWASIIAAVGQGASKALGSSSSTGGSKKEAKERKRATLAHLLSQALQRKHGLSQASKEYRNEMQDTQSNALQNVARGLVQALSGSTRRT